MAIERLQKFFTDSGILSRRAAEKEIAAGKVKVNGVTAVIGQKIDTEKDRVEYLGKPVVPDKKPRFLYVVLNKPAGYVTTMRDEKSRPCVAQLVADVPERVYPVGRLDCPSEGLLLLTNDGDMTYRLTHPKHHIGKEYEVLVRGHVTTEHMQKLNASMTIDDYAIEPVKTEKILETEKETLLKMTLFEGRNRQIRKMCEQVGLSVLRLQRISLGTITLGRLKPGQWRYLSESEVRSIQRLINRP